MMSLGEIVQVAVISGCLIACTVAVFMVIAFIKDLS